MKTAIEIMEELRANYKIEIKRHGVDICEQDGGVIFELDMDTLDELQEVLIAECKHHIHSIDSHNKDYYDECNVDYLQNEWRETVVKIYSVVKEAE